jgi:hypothetical protein
MRKVLLGLTTTPGSDWKEKVREIDELGIEEAALFPTYLEYEDRQELYKRLENSRIRSIPHVHLRGEDMGKDEIDYLIKRFHTKLFNLHPDKAFSASIDTLSEYKETIFLENLDDLASLEEIRANIKKVGGLCIDYSHWQDRILLADDKVYNALMKELIKNNKIGCCHISAIHDKPEVMEWTVDREPHYSGHHMEKLSDLDYMKNYVNYLPDIISLELENSFEEQLEAKEYIEKLIIASSNKS